MRELVVPIIQCDENTFINEQIDSMSSHFIDRQPWISYRENVEAKFVIAHSSECVFLKFYVKEDFLRASSREHNGAVHKDNCVEFFVAFEEEQAYYNLEFNCLGSCKIGYGTERSNRVFIDKEIIKKIDAYVNFKGGKGQAIEWNLLLKIPKDIFLHSKIYSFKGLSARANFYKCGEGLPRPHFLAWNNIDVPEPDFHRPEFFGKIYFE